MKGRGTLLQMPPPDDLVGPIDAQLHRAGACWGARYSAPFAKQDTVVFTDEAD